MYYFFNITQSKYASKNIFLTIRLCTCLEGFQDLNDDKLVFGFLNNHCLSNKV